MASDKINKAIEIFKAKLPEAKGKFKAWPPTQYGNVVEISNEDGLYCTVNVKSGLIRWI